MRTPILTALKGLAMGIAEVIPGVSGGTIAFITGIYEKLLNTIKAFGPELVRGFKKEGIAGAWKTINGSFLVALLMGMGLGVVAGVFGVSHLLEHYPVLLWAFFFGLIIASAIYIGKHVGKWRSAEIIALVVGTVVAYIITVASPAEGNHALWFVFISGMIAISALILPGISGSFILLLMGMYTFIIPSVKKALETQEPKSLTVLVAFAAGCLVGLAIFSRVLSWTFKNYRTVTLATLTGFMLGSLNKIWPWRKPVRGLDEEGNMIEWFKGVHLDKVIKEVNLTPGSFAEQVGEPYTFWAIILIFVGFGIVFAIEWLGRKK